MFFKNLRGAKLNMMGQYRTLVSTLKQQCTIEKNVNILGPNQA